MTTHGMTGSPEWISWQHMKARCLNERATGFKNYGGRGIRIHPEWASSFEAFLRELGPRPSGHTLDRIDNDGHYEPGNVRWATPAEQAQTRRPRSPIRSTRELHAAPRSRPAQRHPRTKPRRKVDGLRVRPPRPQRGPKRALPKTLSRAEVEALLKAPNLNAPTGLRDRCMLELMYRAGLRVGEVCDLKPRDVDVVNGTIRVVDGKGGDGTAYFDSESLQILLERWKRVRRGLPNSVHLFCTLDGGRVSERSTQMMMKRRAQRAGITARVHPHMLRHTFATELLNEGFNIREVQEAMRHKDIVTTQIYTHVLDEGLRSKIQLRRRRA